MDGDSHPGGMRSINAFDNDPFHFYETPVLVDANGAQEYQKAPTQDTR